MLLLAVVGGTWFVFETSGKDLIAWRSDVCFRTPCECWIPIFRHYVEGNAGGPNLIDAKVG